MMSETSCRAAVEANASIAVNAYANEVSFHFGSDENLIIDFDPQALSKFLAVAPAALETSRKKLAEEMAAED